MKKIMLVLPVIFSIFVMGSAMASLKPYCQEKITTGAYDFFPNIITTLNDQLGNPIEIYYLNYGLANSQVTVTSIYQNSAVEPSYQGKLYFYASGTTPTYPYLSMPDKQVNAPWSVTLLSQGNIYCSEFTKTDMQCAAMAIYKVQKAGGGQEMVCMQYEAHSTTSATPDMVYVKAYAGGTLNTDGTCTGSLVVDAATSSFCGRIPKMHVTFNWWDNFVTYPQCKWWMRSVIPVAD